MNDANEYLLVIDRVASKQYAMNDEGECSITQIKYTTLISCNPFLNYEIGLAEYTKALAFTGQLHGTSIKGLRPTSSTTAAATSAEVDGSDAAKSVTGEVSFD